MATSFKLTIANINKLTEIGLKPASAKVIEELLKAKKPLDRTNLEAGGLSTEEIYILNAETTSGKDEHVPEIKRGIIKIKGVDDKSGFSLVVRYEFIQEKDDVENIIVNEEVYSIVSGQARFEYDDKIAPEVFRLLVKSPGGDFVKIKIEASEGLELDCKKAELGKKDIEVTEIIKLITTEKKPVSVTKLKGRLLSKSSSRKLEKIQIVIQVSVNDNPQENNFFPVCYAVTEQDGYFFTSQIEIIPSDLEKIKAARALIGLPQVTSQNIRLIEQDINGNKILTLPEKIILFIDDEESDNKKDEDDCGCDCKNLDFHDIKALEEFSFYSVVRTTEPLIEAYEISDVKKIDLKEIVSDKELKGILGGYILPPSAINNFIIKNGPITKTNASNLLNIAKQYQQIDNVKAASRIKEPKFKRGRIDLDGNNEIDWDDKPTIYQSTSIAHGHLLHFKQEWFNDGYTIGDLLYSLPLAPGQKKQIVVFDWDRKDSASNTQQLDYQESLYNSLSRDRDVNEIARASVSEHTRGDSSANTWGVGGGIGGVIGSALIGVAGGFGKSSSSANQDSSRNSTASSLQHINDRTVQSASSVRSQRATVIQTVSQGERFQVSAEVVANYNHCHAMTIQYFEVLRHFEIRTRLADVQECLFIPLKLSPFDRKKALRWRDILSQFMNKRLLLPGFNALERYDDAVEKCGVGNSECIDKHYDDLGIPDKWYAEEPLQYIEGELYLEFQIKMPQILPDVTETLASTGWSAFGGLLGGGSLQSLFEAEVKNESRKDEAFAKHVGPKVADSIINGLQFHAVKNGQSGSSKLLPLDATLLSDFRNRARLNVSLRMKGAFDGTLKREDIDFVKISFSSSLTPSSISSLDTLIRGDYVRIIVHSGSMRYRTQSLHEYLFRDSNIKNDLRINDTVNIFSPLSEKALKRPRLDDVELSNALLHHLNENIEYYHQCIWLKMDAQRRFMLLDGLIAPGKGKGRSVASVVENKLIGIVGNCLVMPVAPGFQLDPTLDDSIDLFEHYYEKPKDPLHISLPTKGVFAEAVMGKCNSCEKKDETRFWRWEESPIPDSPTTINPVSTPVPQNVQPNLEAKDFPTPIVNMQNAPALPDPQGYGALTTMLSNPNLFKDITGLAANQSNALGAMQSSLAAAQKFASMAKELESQKINQQQSDSIIDAIKNSGLPQETQNKLIQDHLEQRIDGGASKKAEQVAENKKNEPSAMGIAKDAEAKGKPVKAETQDKEGNTQKVEVGAGKQGEQILAEAKGYYQLLKQKPDKPNSCWAVAATIMMSWKKAKELTVEEVLTEAGDSYLIKYQGDDTLRTSEKDGFIEALNMMAEPPASYTLQEYIAMLNAYGPLWITTDVSEEEGEFSPHARILYKITGTSPTDESTAKFHFKDPTPNAEKNEQGESFETFLKKYEQMVTDDDSENLTLQIVHFKDLMGTGEGAGTPAKLNLTIKWTGVNNGDLDADVEVKSEGTLLGSGAGDGSATILVDWKSKYSITITPRFNSKPDTNPDKMYVKTTESKNNTASKTNGDPANLTLNIKLKVNRWNFTHVLTSWTKEGVVRAKAEDVVTKTFLGKKVTINKLVESRVISTQAAFNALPAGELDRIKLSILKIGSRTLRTMTGTEGIFSNHSLGCALDVNENMSSKQNHHFLESTEQKLLVLVQEVVREQVPGWSTFDIVADRGIRQLDASDHFTREFPNWLYMYANDLAPEDSDDNLAEIPGPNYYSVPRLQRMIKALDGKKLKEKERLKPLFQTVIDFQQILTTWISGVNISGVWLTGMICLDRKFLEIMLANGWSWGGDYNSLRKDYMHFEDMNAVRLIKTP